MSAGFGWSLSDTVLLAKWIRITHNALKTDGGSSSKYQKATTTLKDLQITLEEIQHLLTVAEPSFKNAVIGQLANLTSSIAEFNEKLRDKYGDALCNTTSRKKWYGTWRKIEWAISAAEELSTFWVELLRQLAIVKLLLLTKTEVTVLKTGTAVSEIGTAVKAGQQALATIHDECCTLSSQTRETRMALEPPLNIIQAACSRTSQTVTDFRDECHGSLKDIGNSLCKSQGRDEAVAMGIDNLTKKVSGLSVQLEDISSTKYNTAPRDHATLESVIELHKLIKDFKDHQEGIVDRSYASLANQYIQVQERIDDIGRAQQSLLDRPSDSSTQDIHLLLNSRNWVTRAIVELVDSTGATIEKRWERLPHTIVVMRLIYESSLASFRYALQACYYQLL